MVGLPNRREDRGLLTMTKEPHTRPVSDECVREMLAALRECANRLKYDADLLHQQGLESRRDAAWAAMEMAEAAIERANSQMSRDSLETPSETQDAT
jgi:hypothetical protein